MYFLNSIAKDYFFRRANLSAKKILKIKTLLKNVKKCLRLIPQEKRKNGIGPGGFYMFRKNQKNPNLGIIDWKENWGSM